MALRAELARAAEWLDHDIANASTLFDDFAPWEDDQGRVVPGEAAHAIGVIQGAAMALGIGVVDLPEGEGLLTPSLRDLLSKKNAEG